jgi:pyruvate dehydrogenase E1 component beta subunit
MSTPNNTERQLRYVDALREGVQQEMERDPRVFVFGIDVDDHKAIQGSIKGLRERFGSDRVFSTPLSEDAMTGVAIGAAMAGLRPVHVHIRMDFLLLCMNQLVNIAAKANYMSGGGVRVPLVVRSMIGKSWGQGAQHSQALHAMFMHVPGLKVVAPSNAYDAKGCMIAAIRDDNPVIFVEHRLLYPLETHVPEEPYTVEFGKARVCTSGDDITVVGVSNMLVECLRAGELLAERGIKAEVIDPVSLVPLDMETILESVSRTGRLLVVDNAWTNCGASAEILARVAESLGPRRGVAMARMGFAATTCPPSPTLEDEFYPNAARIAIQCRSLVHPGEPAWPAESLLTAMPDKLPFRGPF